MAQKWGVCRHLRLQSTGLRYWHWCLVLTEKGQTSGHAWRSPLNPCLAWCKEAQGGPRVTAWLLLQPVNNTVSWQKIPLAGRVPGGSQAASMALLRWTRARTTGIAPKINEFFGTPTAPVSVQREVAASAGAWKEQQTWRKTQETAQANETGQDCKAPAVTLRWKIRWVGNVQLGDLTQSHSSKSLLLFCKATFH